LPLTFLDVQFYFSYREIHERRSRAKIHITKISFDAPQHAPAAYAATGCVIDPADAALERSCMMAPVFTCGPLP
jgi:hypothetical protein